MADCSTAIQVSGLWKRLGGRAVLRDVNFSLQLGEMVAVIGANGAGKTTLLRCLASLLRPCAGSIRWLGQEQPLSVRLRRSLGYAGHDTFLYPHLTVEENLMFAARMHEVATPVHRVREQLETAGLAPLSRVLVSQLSPGMRRRLSLLRAVVHDPVIVLLDEPSAGLDTQGQQWLIHQLQEMRRTHHCVCYVTHEEVLVSQLADRVLALNEGRIEPHTPARFIWEQDPAMRKQAA